MSDDTPSDLPLGAIEKWEDDFEQWAGAGHEVSPYMSRLLDHYWEVRDQ